MPLPHCIRICCDVFNRLPIRSDICGPVALCALDDASTGNGTSDGVFTHE